MANRPPKEQAKPHKDTLPLVADVSSPELSVWTYRGYRLRAGEFNTAMVHFYRAEVTRTNTWRNRLDVTTNWAIVSTGLAMTLAFGDPQTHHSVIILSTLLITLFLYIEARRYRYYELWSYRIRLMETDFLAAMLVPPFRPDEQWSEKLAASLLNPQFPISFWEAFGRRFRRNYMWIFAVLALAWLVKVLLVPDAITSWDDLFRRSSLGSVPGRLVLLVGVLFNGILLVIGLLTLRLREASGEILPRYGSATPAHKPAQQKPSDPQTVTRPTARAFPFLALVTVDQADAVCERIRKDLKRDVTRLDPNNTTGSRATVMFPVQLTEIAQVRALVREIDPQGVAVVISADDLLAQSETIQQGDAGGKK